MEKRNYQELLNKLVNGELDELKIEPQEFMDFQTAFMNFRQRKRIIGIAQRHGTIYYHYRNNNTL
ncbi:MAG: hypothetical protein ABF804_09725 [Liquorilactobacillus ghanensis]|jgi:hypothetical protein|uniref:Uncharacterized protein n=1 Tax=Liquorilactobacillus ghanensis DSM 18630 TaxID=1423750 RepID=A0A0R1VVK0_9LACO|nr:hypothetical protein [Liquorilactobacillus ghanensis]KRM06790.1 hypothetical protein FC89_GL000489 [Liquorilactobacillus ghanensis DSM 18630]